MKISNQTLWAKRKIGSLKTFHFPHLKYQFPKGGEQNHPSVKNVNFEFPQNWTLWVLLLQKCLTLTKARSRFLEVPHGEKLQNVFSFHTPMKF